MGASAALSREKHEAILDGATHVFAQRGYAGASMSMITTAAGVSKGTIYQHFASKAELFGATVGRECQGVLAPAFAQLNTSCDLATALRDIGLHLVALLTSPAGLAIERIVTSEAAQFPELAQAFYAAGPGRAIGIVADLLAEQTRQGRLNVADPALAAEQFFQLCQTRVVSRRRLGIACETDPEQVVDAAVMVFMTVYGRQAEDWGVSHPPNPGAI